MKVSQYDLKNKELETKLQLNEAVWGVKYNQDLVSQALYVYQSNQRAGLSHAKTRGDVSGGGKKPWKQKGTGRARSGSTRSPLWAKGGVTFVPNDKNWKRKLNRKMRDLALKIVLSKKLADEEIKFVDFSGTSKPADYRAGLDNSATSLLITDDGKLQLAVRNIEKFDVTTSNLVNVYDIVQASKLIVDVATLAKIEERLTNGK